MDRPVEEKEPAALRLVKLSKRFGSTLVVQDLDLVARQGEFVALLGESGCGKTTTLRLIAGFEYPDGGSIEIGGHVVDRVPPERRHVGMVFQDGALFPHMQVAENVAFGLPKSPDRDDQVARALQLVGLAGLGRRFPHELSGGQLQRVALARALAPGPDIILLDEPFSNIDAAMRASLRAEVRDILTAANATTLLVTHDQEEALSLADRVAVMWDGRIIQDAPPEELYYRPVNKHVAKFVGESHFLPGEMEGRRVACELGTLPAYGQPTGRVEVMVRPEMLRMSPAGGDSPDNASVLTRLFFGHDQLMRIQLDTGSILTARLGTYGGIRPGDRVHVTVRGAVLTFPRDE